MRQHVREGPRIAQKSFNLRVFLPRVVTSGITLSQEYEQRGLYSFVTRLLQICANVKSARLRRNKGDRRWRGPPGPHNQTVFNALQGDNSKAYLRIGGKTQSNLNERFTLSTRFSTEDRVSNLRARVPLKEPQVSKNRGFARFYSPVTRRIAKLAVQMARGPRRSRTGSIKMALTRPRTP
jgi:hypothetical protein